ncbi:MAG TPA: hypothetical protein VK991_09200 [Halomonas sp.]|nr:hypothetical protein [Halomonas sp.]
MTPSGHADRSRLKLVLLFACFLLPVVIAWVMVHWRLGIPEGRTAHGELRPEVPALSDWPLSRAGGDANDGVNDWLLAFDCAAPCGARADRWWRVHRALGRDADRLARLRIGGEESALPGERVAQWTQAPEWRSPGDLWLLDVRGRAVVRYSAEVEAEDVLEDIERLLKMNPVRVVARLESAS